MAACECLVAACECACNVSKTFQRYPRRALCWSSALPAFHLGFSVQNKGVKYRARMYVECMGPDGLHHETPTTGSCCAIWCILFTFLHQAGSAADTFHILARGGVCCRSRSGAGAVQELCMSCAGAVQVLCRSCAGAVQELCRCLAGAVQELCRHAAGTAYA